MATIPEQVPKTKRLTEEEHWICLTTLLDNRGLWTIPTRDIHVKTWDARQPEIDAIREALKQCEAALTELQVDDADMDEVIWWLRMNKAREDAEQALAAARAVLEQGPETPEEREAAIDALDARDRRNLRWAGREVYGQ